MTDLAENGGIMTIERQRQMRRLQEFAARGDPVYDITVLEHMTHGLDFNDLCIRINSVVRHHRVISCVRYDWPGVGFVATLGLYLKNPQDLIFEAVAA